MAILGVTVEMTSPRRMFMDVIIISPDLRAALPLSGQPVLRQWDGNRNYRMQTTINGQQTRIALILNRILDDIGALMLFIDFSSGRRGHRSHRHASRCDGLDFSPGDDVRLKSKALVS